MNAYLDRIEAELRELIAQPYPTDVEVPDVVGRLAAISLKVNGLKRDLLAEVSEPSQGEHYQIVGFRKADRSYNTAAILAEFADAPGGGWGISELRKLDAVRLTWRWTELKRAVHEAGVGLRITSREIDDDGDMDAPMVGEVWSDDWQVKGI